MKLTDKDLGRNFVCKNSKQGKLFKNKDDPSKFIGVIFLEPCGPYFWGRDVELDLNGQALNKELDEYSIKELV